MQQQWRIRIHGKQRNQVAISLVVQAVLALGKQLRQEEAAKQLPNETPTVEQPAPDMEALS